MPLEEYGVLVGAYNCFARDPPVDYGNAYHGLLYLNAPLPGGQRFVEWRCGLAVKAPNGGVEYLRMPIAREHIASTLALDPGFHRLPRTANSGALDYARSPFAVAAPRGRTVFHSMLERLGLGRAKRFCQNVDGSALDTLNEMLLDIRRAYVFGEPYAPLRPGNVGMRNIHMNQGDAPPAPGDPDYGRQRGWYESGGAWQDGGVVIEHNDGQVEAFIVKFLKQTLHTNDDGHPMELESSPTAQARSIRPM